MSAFVKGCQFDITCPHFDITCPLTIKVRILNTGAGMTPPQLAQVRSTLELDFAPAKGMGLFNINKRLQLQYGTQLSIRSRPAHGTVVAFSFPAQRYEPPQPD